MAQLINMSINNSVPTEPHDFLTTREAAELLGVALRTVQLWVEAGTLSAWKTAGGHRRITRESVEAMLKRQTAARQGSIVADHSPRGFHILVVDDDATMREIMVTVIRSWNLPVTVSTAEDGFAALLCIGETHPDLLLTDLVMPGMDGYRMIRHLRAMPEAHVIDVIAISGQDPAEIFREGQLPADIPLLPKPVPFDKLHLLLQQRIAARS
jgi:excisionase family DNA binding protein